MGEVMRLEGPILQRMRDVSSDERLEHFIHTDTLFKEFAGHSFGSSRDFTKEVQPIQESASEAFDKKRTNPEASTAGVPDE